MHIDIFFWFFMWNCIGFFAAGGVQTIIGNMRHRYKMTRIKLLQSVLCPIWGLCVLVKWTWSTVFVEENFRK